MTIWTVSNFHHGFIVCRVTSYYAQSYTGVFPKRNDAIVKGQRLAKAYKTFLLDGRQRIIADYREVPTV